MKRIYLAGPMDKDPDRRRGLCLQAGAIACELVAAGFAVYCPHLSDFAPGAHDVQYGAWLAQDLHWIRVCDAVLRLPGESPGADAEVAYARATGIQVAHLVDFRTAVQCLTDSGVWP